MMDDQEYQDVGYMPRMDATRIQPLLDKHLDASEIIDRLKNLLLGKEYDEEKGRWVDSTMEITTDNGQVVVMKQGPLIDPRKIQTLSNYLTMILNSNTYLSKLSQDEINDTMWDINKELMPLFMRLLKHRKIDADTMRLLWGMIEKPIHFGLKRASEGSAGGMTINAATKMQHSIEHIQANQRNNPPEPSKKEFKALGW